MKSKAIEAPETILNNFKTEYDRKGVQETHPKANVLSEECKALLKKQSKLSS